MRLLSHIIDNVFLRRHALIKRWVTNLMIHLRVHMLAIKR